MAPSDKTCPGHDAAIGSRVGWKTFSIIVTIATLIIAGCVGMSLTSLLASTKAESEISSAAMQLDRIEKRLDRIEAKIDGLNK